MKPYPKDLKEEIEVRRSNYLRSNDSRYFMFKYYGDRSILGDDGKIIEALTVKVDVTDGSYKIISGISE